jgi:hypothetical protein
MDCAHLPAIHPHSKLRGILAFSRDNNTGPTHHQAVANPWRECTTQLTGQYIALVVRCQSEGNLKALWGVAGGTTSVR